VQFNAHLIAFVLLQTLHFPYTPAASLESEFKGVNFLEATSDAFPGSIFCLLPAYI